MKIVLSLIIFLSGAHAHAHQMSDKTKKIKILDSLSEFSTQIRPKDIEIDFSFYNLTLTSIIERFTNTADLDMEEFLVRYQGAKQQEFEISCDMITGEYIFRNNSGRYFIIFKNCIKKNLSQFTEEEIQLNKQVWTDWRYQK